MSLIQGKSVAFEGVTLRYEGYRFVVDSAEGNIVTLVVEVLRGGVRDTILPKMMNRGGKVSYVPASTPDGTVRLAVTGMNLDPAAA
ncbi:MAG: hypothetical protein NTV54_08380, partial [Ignavibacteriales bacterium]|nr:hypothetical protein [Ignavibacteriales bacterium]